MINKFRSFSEGPLRELADQGHIRLASGMKGPEKGLKTYTPIDQLTAWGGLPPAGLTLLRGYPGSGALSFWLQVARNLTRQNQWVAHFQCERFVLCPSAFIQGGGNLEYLFVVKSSEEQKKIYWALSEIIRSEIFETVSFDITGLRLSLSQILNLQRLCEKNLCNLTILDRENHISDLHNFSLVLDFKPHRIIIARNAHRVAPVEIVLKRSFYESALLASGVSERSHRELSTVHPPYLLAL